jgi:hypothetical protein
MMQWAILVALAAIVILAWGESSSDANVQSQSANDLLNEVNVMANDIVSRLAQAIAKAEGFFKPGSLPNRTNNPGDLKLGDLGYGTVAGKTVFSSADQGWSALEKQVQLMLSGQSRYYSPDMTIRQIAETYTGSDNADAWANIVASELGVDPDTPIGNLNA